MSALALLCLLHFLVQESVRDAAEIACRLLSRVTIRACDPTGPGASKAMAVLGKIFPVLLEQGMSSTVQETRAIRCVQCVWLVEVYVRTCALFVQYVSTVY